MSRVLVILCGCLLLAGMVCAQAPAKLPALAVLVQAKPGGEALADQLRPLLEAEVSRYWEGGLVERTNIDRLLKDLNRVVTANVPPMQFGVRYLGSALIYILVFPDHIQLFLTGVPGAEAIFPISARPFPFQTF